MSLQIFSHAEQDFAWLNESTQKPPLAIEFHQHLSAEQVLRLAHQNTATVWTGDFQQAKQVLSALKKRVRNGKAKKPLLMPSADGTAAEKAAFFHQYRMQQAQQSRLINMLAVAVQPDFSLELNRAPNVANALHEALAENADLAARDTPFLLPLNRLLGFIGAHEWHKKGVYLSVLQDKIHVPFGVFSPLRGEYLDLLAQALQDAQPKNLQTAWDIGTGSGVLAAILAKAGLNVVATDTNPRALNCSAANLTRLGLDEKVTLKQQDLFPDGTADLIVCNPPWLPAKPTSAIETALYDPDSSMLKAFLHGAKSRLNPHGEAWLIMSNLAELLGLRSPDFLAEQFAQAGLQVVAKLDTRPTHTKAQLADDPLAFARQNEITSLYRLTAR
ncbi:MAG: class I SAM-dependent methyltransferase [Neisseria sp.]|nr:class I SAM-dependent methyltransferase [Neisseria sp.]